MKTIRILIEYDGNAYHGWQVQKDEVTVQGILEEKVFRLTGEHSCVTGASRTDAGVHALGQVAAFRTASHLDAGTIRRALNAMLPQDIRILAAAELHRTFHPRDDALRKRYFYMIANQRVSSAFLFKYTWIVPQRLNVHSMEEAVRVLVGRHDFSAFMGSGSDIKNTVREVFALGVQSLSGVAFMGVCLHGDFIKITAEADGFLRHMVRNIVGTLVEIGRGRIQPVKMEEILKSRDRRNAGQTAPANGLFLERIDY